MKHLIGRVSALAAGGVIYLPVIAGIITPMLWILPAWYAVWYGLGYIVPFSASWPGLWLPSYDPVAGMHNPSIVVAIWLISLGTFLPGLALLLYGLGTMVTARVADRGLVTTGPYRWVRHPQHLGIILMLFLPALLRDVILGGIESTLSIRPGDLISVSFVTFLLLVVADLEEMGLQRKFGSEYVEYSTRTPFIVPVRTTLRLNAGHRLLALGRPARYLLAFLTFWTWAAVLSYLCSGLPLLFVR